MDSFEKNEIYVIIESSFLSPESFKLKGIWIMRVEFYEYDWKEYPSRADYE